MLQQADWRALGTGVRVLVHAGEIEAAREAVTRVLDDVDRTYSRFRADSELSRLNATAAASRVPVDVQVSQLLARTLAGSLDAARQSGGAVDPTVGASMRVIGYDGDFAKIAGSSRTIELKLAPVPGWSRVLLDVDRDGAAPRVRMPAGIELDLGSTGKGLAADLAAQAALAAVGEGAGVLVSLGGDIATAGVCPEGGWRILVAEDSNTASDADGEVIAIESGAVATSTTTVRRWTAGEGVSAHHIVDPRTGLSAHVVWRTVTTVAATCEAANAASTAAIVMGDAAVAWLEANGLPARLVAADGTILRIGGWPAPEPEADPDAEREAEPGHQLEPEE
jgi:thiamine biosynthesis lipoprotein